MSQLSLMSVSGQSEVILRSLFAYFVRQTEPKILRLVDLAANSGQGPLLLSSGGKGALVLVSQTKPKKKRFRALDKLVLNGQTDRKTHFDTLRS